MLRKSKTAKDGISLFEGEIITTLNIKPYLEFPLDSQAYKEAQNTARQ